MRRGSARHMKTPAPYRPLAHRGHRRRRRRLRSQVPGPDEDEDDDEGDEPPAAADAADAAARAADLGCLGPVPRALRFLEPESLRSRFHGASPWWVRLCMRAVLFAKLEDQVSPKQRALSLPAPLSPRRVPRASVAKKSFGFPSRSENRALAARAFLSFGSRRRR